MKIERLSTDNLRDGIFCAKGKPNGEEMHSKLEVWLNGSILRGLIAREENGEVVGFVIYYPIEQAPMDVSGEGLYMVQCLHVKEGYRNKGVGKALIEASLADAKENGASGIAVEAFRDQGQSNKSYLPGTFFQHIGMTQGESRGAASLYYVQFDENGMPPEYLNPSLHGAFGTQKLRIDVFDCGSCYLGISNRKLVEAILEDQKDVELVVHNQVDRQAIVDKGMSSGIFIDGKLTYFKGPVSEEDVMNAIEVARIAKNRAYDR
jgi:GNAT superfamily N-acetyltransferase